MKSNNEMYLFFFCSLTVQKEGPNKGRQFYGCPAPRGQGCNFFQWADDDGGGGGGGGFSSGGMIIKFSSIVEKGLISTFAVRIWHKTRYRMTWPIYSDTRKFKSLNNVALSLSESKRCRQSRK